MLALRRIEENETKNRESKALTVEAIHALDYSGRLELFETACKVFAVPIEVRCVWTFLMVQGYVNLLAVYLDKKSYEETSEGVSSVHGRDRGRRFQENTANPSQKNRYGMKAGW